MSTVAETGTTNGTGELQVMDTNWDSNGTHNVRTPDPVYARHGLSAGARRTGNHDALTKAS